MRKRTWSEKKGDGKGAVVDQTHTVVEELVFYAILPRPDLIASAQILSINLETCYVSCKIVI